MTFDQSHTDRFVKEGYVVAERLFDDAEVERLRAHVMELTRRDRTRHHDSSDPLRRYPRLLQPHRRDTTTLEWMLEARMAHALRTLLGSDPYAVQSMVYFKPPGARGQALHQDNFYLKVDPGTCVAAWMALDDTDPDNGCMRVVPGSHRWPILCTREADTRVSFTDVTVPLPEDQRVDDIRMRPGDVLFFNGSVVHGSGPNVTAERFRRAMIAHYIHGEAERVAEYYHPALRMDGSPVELDVSAGGGACGEWVDLDTAPRIAMTGAETVTRKHE